MDIIRRGSDIRILSDADLQYSAITADRKESAGIGALVRRQSSSANIHLGKKRSTVSVGIAEGEEDDIKDPRAVVDDFKFETVGLSTLRAEELLTVHGHNELPEKHVPKWYIFVSLLWQPMPVSSLLSIISFLNLTVCIYLCNS